MMEQDSMNAVHERTAVLDIHKMQVAATVRLARPGLEAEVETRAFSALPNGLAGMAGQLSGHRVSEAAVEANGICREALFDALESVGIEPLPVHLLHVKQLRGRKADAADSLWLSRIRHFGLCSPSLAPSVRFRRLRKVSRVRRELVRNRIHKIVDASGTRVGGVPSELFRAAGLRILEKLADGAGLDVFLAGLSTLVWRLAADLHDLSTRAASRSPTCRAPSRRSTAAWPTTTK